MNLEQLKMFVEAARHGSFTLAAGSLGVTQSAISISMRKLEETLDVVLFNRVGNGLSLTDAGRALLREAERILADVQLTVQRIETYRYAPKRRLLVACSQNAHDHWMSAIVTNLLSRKDLPQIDIAVGSSREIASWVMRGTVDFGLTESEPGHGAIHYWDVFEDRLRLYASQEIASRLGPQPSWRALENIGPILWEHGGDLEPFVLHAFEKHRLREQRIRHDGLRLRSLIAVYAAIATGRHAGYVTERLAEGLTGGNPGFRPIPAYDILIRYWFFGPHQGLGQLLSEAIKSEAVKLARSPIKEESNGRES
ncbi:LysR family transcriptional regulator [Paraburkholderia atlantica]|uniref:LysR family transcriptional regulator n=1 Tax=Paraburkholderia atlantica TaxID=2654982 RepID=UPI00036F5514|nr:LysR family transcriptional regulator [Paraburkholderia atlantica]